MSPRAAKPGCRPRRWGGDALHLSGRGCWSRASRRPSPASCRNEPRKRLLLSAAAWRRRAPGRSRSARARGATRPVVAQSVIVGAARPGEPAVVRAAPALPVGTRRRGGGRRRKHDEQRARGQHDRTQHDGTPDRPGYAAARRAGKNPPARDGITVAGRDVVRTRIAHRCCCGRACQGPRRADPGEPVDARASAVILRRHEEVLTHVDGTPTTPRDQDGGFCETVLPAQDGGTE